MRGLTDTNMNSRVTDESLLKRTTLSADGDEAPDMTNVTGRVSSRPRVCSITRLHTRHTVVCLHAAPPVISLFTETHLYTHSVTSMTNHNYYTIKQ